MRAGCYPGDARLSTLLDFGTPLFTLVKYHLENGKTFTIHANGVSPVNIYLAARLNGVDIRAAVVPFEDIEKGGTLEFEMADQPSMTTFATSVPQRSRNAFPAVPIIDGPGRVFSGKATITLRSTDPKCSAALFNGFNWAAYALHRARSLLTVTRTSRPEL